MSVVAFIDHSTSDAVVDYAAWACARLDQPLVIVLLEDRNSAEQGLSFDDYQSMHVQEDVLRELRSSDSRRDSDSQASGYDRVLTAAAQQARERGVAHLKLREAHGPLNHYIAENTDSDDLLIIPRFDEEPGGLGKHLDAVLHVQHRTMMIVPRTLQSIERWLLAYDGKPGTGEAVRYLSKFPLLQGIPGRAVIAGNDGFGKIHFRDAVNHLQNTGHDVKSHELRGAPEDILLAVLDVTESDLLIMSAFGHGRLRTLVEGSTTSRLLKAFHGPILVSRA